MKKRLTVALLAAALELTSMNPSVFAKELQMNLASERETEEKLTYMSEISAVGEVPAGQMAGVGTAEKKTEEEPSAFEESAGETAEAAAEEKVDGEPEDEAAGGGTEEKAAEELSEAPAEAADGAEEAEGIPAWEAQALSDESEEAVAEEELSLENMEWISPDAAANMDLSSFSFPITDLRDPSRTGAFQGGDGKQAVIVFGGMGACQYTESALFALTEIENWVDMSKLNLYVFEIKGASDAEVMIRAARFSDNIWLNSVANDAKYREFYNACLQKTIGVWKDNMPLIVYKGTDGKIYHYTVGKSGISPDVISGNLERGGLRFDGDMTRQTLRVTGEADYRQAWEVLALLNAEREKAGLGRLKMDRDLLEAAMERAAECSFYFSHTRPDGRACATISGKLYGENAAVGQKNAQKVMDAWMNSPGHKENILRSYFRSVGIGCFYNDGIYRWVQCFGVTDASEVSPASNKAKTYAVDAVSKYLVLRMEAEKQSLKVGETVQLEVRASTRGYPALVSADSYRWTSSDASVATVDGAGLVTAKKAGSVRITAAEVANGEATLTYDVTVAAAGSSGGSGGGDSGGGQPDDVPATGLWANPVEPQMYTGGAVKPKLEVYYNENLLTGKEYTVSYRDNVNASASAPTVIVTGKGNAKGKVTLHFEILPKDISGEEVAVSNLTARFDGDEKQPAPVLSYRGKKLKKGRDYTVASDACRAPGSIEFVVKGRGNYQGERTLTFTITGDRPLSKTTVAKIPGQTYQGSEVSPTPVVKDGKRILTAGVDYSVSYQKNVQAGTAKLTLTGIPSGGYTGTKTIAYKIRPCSVKSAQVKVELAASYPLAPGGCKPEPVVTFQGETLVKGVDYTLSYRNNKKASAVTSGKKAPAVVIKGRGNFGGSCERTFIITK